MKNEVDAEGPRLKQADDHELRQDIEKRMARRAEQWGENLDKKITGLESRLPIAVSALLDGVCLVLFLFLACWVMARIGWISLPAWKFFGLAYVMTFVISLVVRMVRKSSKA